MTTETAFNQIEDNNPGEIERIAQEASKKAVKESHALGLSVTFAENGVIYSRSADGEKRKIAKIEGHARKVKKGTVFHVK